jgi:hypothetical protein
MDGSAIRDILIESKSGRAAVLGRIVVDCTGDAGVAVRAGVRPDQIDVRRLQEELRAKGAYLRHA